MHLGAHITCTYNLHTKKNKSGEEGMAGCCERLRDAINYKDAVTTKK